jgi:rod shape determining protein RodA
VTVSFWRNRFDWPLVLALAGIVAVGLVNLYSATQSSQAHLFKTQLGWLAAGTVVFVLCAAVDYRVFSRFAYVAYAVPVLLLAAVLVIGVRVKGSVRWINLGMRLEPSEIMKIALILALARWMQDDEIAEERPLVHHLIPWGLALLPVGLVLKQPDLGTGLILTLITLTIMVFIKLRPRSVLLMGLGGLVAIPVVWHFLEPYQRQRLMTFLHPSQDPRGAAYHGRQSVVAIGSGRLTGKGFLHSTQAQFNFLPEHTTDFPFAVFGEEWGFVGALVLLALYLLLILQAINLASTARDRFGQALCVGIAALLFWQVFMNIGMATGILPVVGVTLPLVSYGGSSLLAVMAALGLLMNVSIRRYQF